MPNYKIAIFKAWANRDIERAWSNTYEFVSTSETPTGLIPVAEQLVVAERKMHLTPVEFLQARISTFEAEASGVYDPTSFVTIPLNGTGSRVIASGNQPLDYNVCYVIQRVPSTGRAGRIFLRGLLLEQDVTAFQDGTFRMEGGNPVNTTLLTQFQTDLSAYISPSGDAGTNPYLALIGLPAGGTGVQSRPVTALRDGGVSINRRNHRYFDRGTVG